jgi:phage tail-like protein
MRTRPDGRTSWLLSGQTDWRRLTLAAEHTGVSSANGVALGGLADGPLALASADGSLGGLVLPRGFALDAELRVHLLVPDGWVVKRFAPSADAFEVLPAIGGPGSEPRRFLCPMNIAIVGDRLIVADLGNQRVQVFSLRTGALLDLLAVRGWIPYDVAAHAGEVYILDRAQDRVFRHRPYPGRLDVILRAQTPGEMWTRLALDRDGRLYLLRPGPPASLVAYERRLVDGRETWQPGATFTDPGDVRERFEPPPIMFEVDGSSSGAAATAFPAGRFCLPATLRRECRRALPTRRVLPESPLAGAVSSARPRQLAVHRTAASGDRLYVVDAAARRVRLYVDGGRVLRREWGPWDRAGRPVPPTHEDAWDPIDVAAHGECAYVLDAKYGRVWQHRVGRETLRLLFVDPTMVEDPDRDNRWTRIAVDGDGCIRLLDTAGQAPTVERYDVDGNPRGTTADVGELFADNRGAVPDDGLRGRVFDRNGEPQIVDPTRPSARPLFERRGTWISAALDSRIHRCAWHRIRLSLSDLPPGCRVHVSTYASADGTARPPRERAEWQPSMTITAPPQAPPGDDGRFPWRGEGLVQSREGQFLWIWLDLEGDAYRTPVVEEIRIEYPRESLLELLPAVFSADQESRRFLERFLAVFHAEFERFDHAIETMAGLFDPAAVPAGPFLAFLARWLALPLEGEWNDEQNRKLLAAAPRVYPRRGRPDGLRDLLAVYLSNFSGLTLEDVATLGFPRLLEGFQERNHLLLGDPGSSTLGGAVPLWGPARVGRLRLDHDTSGGENELVGVGDPERDVFHAYAHRFRVYVPAAWVPSERAEAMLRRVLDAEKPAHTSYELCLVPSRFQVGVQSTVGVDTIVGDFPIMRLGCAPEEDRAPSAGPRNALNRSTILGAGPTRGRFGLDRHARVGVETILT